MKDLLWFLLKLTISFVLVVAGIFLINLGLDHDVVTLSIGGLACCVVGLLYGGWLYVTNGVSLSDD